MSSATFSILFRTFDLVWSYDITALFCRLFICQKVREVPNWQIYINPKKCGEFKLPKFCDKKCGKLEICRKTKTKKSAGNSNYPNFATESAGNWKLADKQIPKKVREIQILWALERLAKRFKNGTTHVI